MRFRKKPVVNDVPAGAPFQARVGPWLLDCFGIEVADDIRERGDRLLEEVLELLQSHGYDPARVATLRDYVFSRPVGDPVQEVGGVMVTLAAYCCAARIDMHGAGETELARILQPEVTEKIRRKQASKRGLHTPLPTAPEAAPAGEVVGYVYPDDVAELAANRAKGKTWFTHLWSKPTGQAGCPVFAVPQPAPAAQGDPGEFGVGIQPNPKARYWQERADFWRGQAIALGYTPDEGATAQQPVSAMDDAAIKQRARELLAAEYENGHLFDTAHRIRSHEPLPARWQDDCIAIRAITAALRSGSPTAPAAQDDLQWGPDVIRDFSVRHDVSGFTVLNGRSQGKEAPASTPAPKAGAKRAGDSVARTLDARAAARAAELGDDWAHMGEAAREAMRQRVLDGEH